MTEPPAGDERGSLEGTTVLVVPCFNEADRVEPDAFVSFLLGHPSTRILFVDDGSTDDTRSVLRGIARRRPTQVEVCALPRNAGKAEAVRSGLQAALANDPEFVGYWDADLATPLEALPSLASEFARDPELWLAMGSRVQLLGRAIRRHPWRHYLGRVAATAVAELLGAAVYDTQCGAKLMRVTPELDTILVEPFSTRWIFDVELLLRIARTEPEADRGSVLNRRVREVPLERWIDVRGSRIRPADILVLPLDLLRVWWRYR